MSALSTWIKKNYPELVQHRRYIHEHPELSMQEHNTTSYVENLITEWGFTPHRFSWGTGLYCDVFPSQDMSNSPEPTSFTALRADLDALPIEEKTGLDFASSHPGVSHSCGHDMHTAVLLGVAAFLSQPEHRRMLRRPVRLIFQPAEEIMPGGAIAVVQEGVLDQVERIVALHCDPKIPTGAVGTKAGAITSATDVLTVTVRGTGGHTSRPHLSTDTIGALAHLINTLPLVLTRRVDPQSSTIMMWGSIHAGSSANAIPAEGTVTGTLRTRDYAVWKQLESLSVSTIEHILSSFGVDFDIQYQQGVPPVVNDSSIVEELSHIIEKVPQAYEVETYQSGGGEDFSWYLEKIPGAMFRLGVGPPGVTPQTSIDLHRPEFVADEKALALATEIFLRYILDADFEENLIRVESE